MALSVVQHNRSGDNNGLNGSVTVSLSSVTAGNTLVAIIGNGNSSNSNISSFHDTNVTPNTWTLLVDKPSSNYDSFQVYVAYNCSGGTTPVSFQDGYNAASLMVYELAGVANGAVDLNFGRQTYGATASTGVGSSTQTANEILMGIVAVGQTTTAITADSGFTGDTQTQTGSSLFVETEVVSAVQAAPSIAPTGFPSNYYNYAWLLSFADTTLVTTTPKTQTGKARITATTLKTQTGKTRITATAPKSTTVTVDQSFDLGAGTGFGQTSSASFPNTFGETFISSGGILQYTKFRLDGNTSPAGTMVSTIYNTTGTVGSLNTTGTPLAVSDPFDVSVLTSTDQLVTFNFTGTNKIKLAAGTTYAVLVEPNITSGNVNTHADSSSGYAYGNAIGGSGLNNGGTAFSGRDTFFYVYVLPLQDIQGRARISVQVPKTQLAKSRITLKTTKTQAAKSTIAVKQTKTAQGLSSITQTLATDYFNVQHAYVTTQQTQLGQADILATTARNVTATSRITITSAHTTTGKADILRSTLKTTLGRSRITAKTTKNTLGLARVTQTDIHTIAGKSRVTVTVPHTISGKSRITAKTVRTQLGKARVTVTSIVTQLAKADILRSTPRSIQGVADIYKTTSRLITGISRVTQTAYYQISGLARITDITKQAISGLSRITDVVPRTITAISRITASATQTITGLARIERHANGLVTGLSRITAKASHNIQGVSRVTVHTLKSITAKARITAKATQQTSGKARVTQTVQHANTGLSRITITSVATTQAKARVTVTVPRSVVGYSRITAKATQQVLGKARVENTYSASVFGHSRITIITPKLVTGQSRITDVVQRNMLGVGNINNNTTRIQLGQAIVLVGHNETILGQARILRPAPLKAKIRLTTSNMVNIYLYKQQ